MYTGYAKKCINPLYGAPISGYYEERLTKGVSDDLYARAVAFDDGKNKAVVIAIDVIDLGQKYFDAIKTYDALLTEIYGDWRTLPPEEDRICHGDIIVDLEKDWTYYRDKALKGELN